MSPEEWQSGSEQSGPTGSVRIRSRRVRDAMVRTEMADLDADVRARAVRMLESLDAAIDEAGASGGLPGMVADLHWGEAYYEWVIPTFTLGFVVCSDAEEDGWFLLSDDGRREFRRLDEISKLGEILRFCDGED